MESHHKGIFAPFSGTGDRKFVWDGLGCQGLLIHSLLSHIARRRLERKTDIGVFQRVLYMVDMKPSGSSELGLSRKARSGR